MSSSINDDTELLNVELRRQILNYSFVGWIILGVGYLFLLLNKQISEGKLCNKETRGAKKS